MFELREKGKKKRPSHSGLKQGRAAVVAVGKGTGRGVGGGGVWRARWGGGRRWVPLGVMPACPRRWALSV